MSKDKSNKLWVLAGAAAIAGIAYLTLNEDARESAVALANRERAKYYVRHRLNGSDALIQAIDTLPDREINAILAVADKASKGFDNVQRKGSDAFNAILDRAEEVGDDVSGAVNELFN